MQRTDEGRVRTAGAFAAALAVALVVLTGSPVEAQQDAGGDETTAEAVTDSVVQQGDIEYRRETFRYPRRERNPFLPVGAGVEEGPRFKNLVLAGLIYSPAVGSVAVLVDRTSGRRYRVREGERLGQATVLNIRRSDVVFSVSGPNRSRQETLQVEKDNEEVQR